MPVRQPAAIGARRQEPRGSLSNGTRSAPGSVLGVLWGACSRSGLVRVEAS